MTRPLYVDLDHSLIRTDVLVEEAAQLLCCKPGRFPAFLARCLGDRARLKAWLNDEVKLPVEHLPWNPAVIVAINAHRRACGPVFLATATHEDVANSIAEHLQIFDGVLATSDDRNLKGDAKLEAIRGHCKEKGFQSFDYIGDSLADIPVWEEAETGWLVPGNGEVEKKARQVVSRLKTLPCAGKGSLASWIHLLRPQQWAKNGLLFLPLLLAHRISDVHLLCVCALAFISFSLTASAVYAFNDFSDVFRDRAHPWKRTRPFAAGDLPLWLAPIASVGLLVIAGSLGWFGVGAGFVGMLGIYLVANLLYTFWLKHRPIVDAVGLALMYALRIFAGGIAAGVEVSKWLLTFSLFFFLSLAFGKRYQEILPAILKDEPSKKIRGYLSGDLSVVGMSGISSGFISVMVLVLYLYSPEVQKLYAVPVFLWLLCPLLIYWIGRFWLFTGRGYLHDDPVVFALNDRTSWVIGALVLGVLAAAISFS